MNVLILGGTGLISTAISRQLLAAGHEVTVFNRGKTETRFGDGAKQIVGDRYNHPAFIEQIQSGPSYDVIIDMICYSVESGQALVEAVRGKCQQLIFCSTVDVYGKPATKLPYTESEARNSLTEYGRNKTTVENLVMAEARAGKFEATVIRPAATYGEGGVIIHTFGWRTTFLDRIRKGLPVVVHGDGSALWTMCHVDDCAKAFVGACLNPKAYGQSYHATGDEYLTWNRFHEIVAEALGVPCPELVHIPTDVLTAWVPEKANITTYNFQYTNIYDNSKARNDLGFEYTIPFHVGAKRTIDFLIERNRIEDCSLDPWVDELITRWRAAVC